MDNKELAAANQQLYELRRRAQEERAALAAADPQTQTQTQTPARMRPECGRNGEIRMLAREQAATGAAISQTAVSWEMRNAIAGLNAKQGKGSGYSLAEFQTPPAPAVGMTPFRPPAPGPALPAAVTSAPDARPLTVAIPPSLVGAVKAFQRPNGQSGLFAAFRYLVLLKEDAAAGGGWLPLADILKQYATRGSPDYVASRDNLWKALWSAEGIFWTVDKKNGRLWLHGWQRIADGLGGRFDRRFAELPRAMALGGIKDFRAACYGSILSVKRDPVSKAALADAAGLCEASQYQYDQILARRGLLKKTQNMAYGPAVAGDVDPQERAWQRAGGRSDVPGHAFETVDTDGRYGRKNGRWLIWQRPNSYQTSAKVLRRRKQTKHAAIDPESFSPRGNGGSERLRLNFEQRKAAETAARKSGRAVYATARLRASQKTVTRSGWWEHVPA